MILQGMVEASTHWGLYAYLLAQHMDGRLASTNSLQTAARVCLTAILSTDEVLHDLVTFDFVASHLLSAGGGATHVGSLGSPPSHCGYGGDTHRGAGDY